MYSQNFTHKSHKNATSPDIIRYASAIMLECNQQFLVGLRFYAHNQSFNSWQFPQGGIEDGETPLDAAKRELYEETNVCAKTVTWHDDETDWIQVEVPNSSQKIVLKFFYAIANTMPIITMCRNEFIDYRWIGLPAFLDMSRSLFKRDAYLLAAKHYRLIT
jgi:8-oxo-dGTP pyrophosphatase MutT (NUDIX family)